MFQRKHKIFVIKSYYSNGNHGENGNWIYSPRLCLNEVEVNNSIDGFYITWLSRSRLFDNTTCLLTKNWYELQS
jgi:hypothetical protein